ncbi:phage major capsid protein [Enemella evansiae]|uniref:Phage major capsid protein n=1 Tax=Enemella evansiae TaxID=2016499 RepID=A0A255FW21_9ACTN|nr:phage major capsid protein [Enemella evansiae]OYO07888.1 phage major capsid protein [Enemella evansiae]
MATETTRTSAKAWSPDVSYFNADQVIPDALILQCSTISGSIEGDAPVVRVAYVDDAEANFVAEGTEIPEADPTLAEVLVATGKVAQLVRLSREQYIQAGTASLLSSSVARAVTNRANTAFLNQPAPTSPAVSPAPGLLNMAGITAGGAVEGDLDALVDLFATLEAEGAQPTHILIDPLGWANLRKLKTATGSAANLLGAGTNDAQRMLLDVPVLVSPAMPAGTGLVIDKAAVISAVGQIQVATSQDVYFNSDSIGLRCTFRFGQNVVRPERLGKFTVTAAAA